MRYVLKRGEGACSWVYLSMTRAASAERERLMAWKLRNVRNTEQLLLESWCAFKDELYSAGLDVF